VKQIAQRKVSPSFKSQFQKCKKYNIDFILKTALLHACKQSVTSAFVRERKTLLLMGLWEPKPTCPCKEQIQM
jgi:hypothetical protein